MTAAMAMSSKTAETFLADFFDTGLADDRYVVERFRAETAQPRAVRHPAHQDRGEDVRIDRTG